jgi:hypothetical protein
MKQKQRQWPSKVMAQRPTPLGDDDGGNILLRLNDRASFCSADRRVTRLPCAPPLPARCSGHATPAAAHRL